MTPTPKELLCEGEGFDIPKDHSNWTSNSLGIIGDAADKSFTVVSFEPGIYYIIDWKNCPYFNLCAAIPRYNRQFNG